MSGLLRRLAGRAWSGAPPVVHAAARVRPVAAPAQSEPAGAFVPDEAPAAETPRGTRSPWVATAGDRQPRAVAAGDPPPRVVAAGDPPPASVSGWRESISGADEVKPAAPWREDRFPGEITPTPEREVPAGVDPRGPAAWVRQVAAAAAVAARAPTVSARAPADDAQAPTGDRDAGRQRWQPPSPVVAPGTLPAGPRSGTVGTRAAAFPPAVDRERADVHVHIGRIEVTAVREPATARRDRPPERRPMALDEYLEKRRRRSS